jgi:hypothetical protein
MENIQNAEKYSTRKETNWRRSSSQARVYAYRLRCFVAEALKHKRQALRRSKDLCRSLNFEMIYITENGIHTEH